jgi:hypothetical protein
MKVRPAILEVKQTDRQTDRQTVTTDSTSPICIHFVYISCTSCKAFCKNLKKDPSGNTFYCISAYAYEDSTINISEGDRGTASVV